MLKYSNSAQLLERAKKVLAGGVSSEFRKYNYPHALFYSRGEGSRITDVDGNQYLDYTLSQGPLILGHSHHKVLDAINSYSEKGQLFAGQHILEIELAEKLSAIIPSAELMRFCLDGSEAVHAAFRIARAKTGKEKFLRFEGHYHGWLDNVCWGNASSSLEAMGPREDPKVLPWSKGLSPNSANDSIVLPWNDLELLRKTVAERHAEIAAIITEPVMCNNGCIEPVRGFLEGIRQICDQYNIAFILDEVITGFRLGLGGAQQYYGIVPDIAIFAKAMASGYPISAVVGKRSWMSLMEDGTVIQAGTMNSGNSSVAAALATINVLDQEQPYERLFNYGNFLINELRKIAVNNGHKVIIQGPGPMFAISFTALPAIKDYRDQIQSDRQKLAKFIAAMHNEKIRIIGRGLFYISTAHTEEDIQHTINVAKKVFKTL